MKIRTYIILIAVVLGLSTYIAYSDQWNHEAIWKKDGEHEAMIPEQAIRLRILANSDQLHDQWIKRKVRDEILKEINTWQEKPRNLAEARQLFMEKLPVFQRISEKTIASHGFDTPVRVDFGQVPFPTKLYGNQVYPAGNYEALRITIGKGEGENWWCVLFPPLCFIDMSNGDAIQDESVQSASLAPHKQPPAKNNSKKTVEVRFFLLEKGREVLENGL